MKDDDKKSNRFYIVPQTEEEIRRNLKLIEKMREKGLLEKHEKTFRINKDGNILEK